MSFTTTPYFPSALRSEVIQLAATANANLDGSTGAYSAAFTAKAVEGSRVDKIRIHGAATTAAALVRVFYADDGSTYRLIYEIALAAGVTAAAVAVGDNEWSNADGSPLFLMKASSTLKFSTSVAQLTNVHIIGADY